VRSITAEEKVAWTAALAAGSDLLQQAAELTDLLNELVGVTAEDLGLKPALVKKAIKLAFAQKWLDVQAEHALLETLIG